MTTFKRVIALLVALYIPAGIIAGREGDSKCRGISRGKEFVIGFTNNYEPTGAGELHITVVAFSDDLTAVSISSRYRVDENEKYQVSFELPPRGYRRITVPFDFRLEDRSVRSNKVLSVVASSDVTVYGASYESHSTDAFLSLPIDQLGLHHVVASVRSGRQPLLAVIGLTDGTDVHITLTAGAEFEGQSYNTGDVLSFVVGRHEIVQILGDEGSDLSGTTIRSDEAVAAVAGHECAATSGSACDALIEQLVPVDSWGTSHIFTATGSQADSSIYKVAAFMDNTIVSVPGMANQSLNSGEILEVSLPGSGVITSTLPSSITQILRYIDGVLVDPSIIQVPSEEQFAFKFGFATPPSSSEDTSGFFNFANIVVKAAECHLMTMNRGRVRCNGTAVDIPGTEYVVLTLRLPKGEGTYFIEGSAASRSPMSVIVYGYESAESYGFAAGLSLPKEGRLLSVTPFVVSQIGGGVLTTTLPCLKQSNPRKDEVVCRFRDGDSIRDAAGVLTGSDRVRCPTSIFSQVGLTSLEVSLDGGRVFPYSDMIYVAPQSDLPARVNIGGISPDFPFLDLTSMNSKVTILWEPRDFPNTPHVNLGIFMVGTRGNERNERVPLVSQVPNNGRYAVEAATLYEATRQGGRTKRGIDDVVKTVTGAIFSVASDSAETIWVAGGSALVEVLFWADYCFMQLKGEVDCIDWHEVLEEGYRRFVDLPGCPPTMQLAERDRERYTKSNEGIHRYHKGAVDCYRRQKAENGAGAQCCYDERGELLVGPPGGGSADAYPSGTLKHVEYDVEPWIACCYISGLESEDCETYYKYRPPIGPQQSDINRPYDRPRRARATGDPHFITLDQLEYTFNAAGEFILLQSDLNNVTFLGRMEQIPGINASVFSAFVLQAESVPKIQIQRSAKNETLVLLNDRELKLVHDGITLPKFAPGGGVELQINADQTELVVRLPMGVAVSFTLLPDMMSYTVSIDDKFRGQTRGLLGNFNDDPDDDLTSPNGDVLPSDSTLMRIHYDFGLKWAVNRSESIFGYMQSEDFESYDRPDFVPNFDLPDANDITREIAEICGLSTQCLYDVVNTGSLSFGNNTLSVFTEYYEAIEIFEEIVDCGSPSNFANGQFGEVVYYVNRSYTFRCRQSFLPLGGGEVFCDEMGEWSGEFPVCASVWVIVAVAAAVAVMLLIVILCVTKLTAFRNSSYPV